GAECGEAQAAHGSVWGCGTVGTRGSGGGWTRWSQRASPNSVILRFSRLEKDLPLGEGSWGWRRFFWWEKVLVAEIPLVGQGSPGWRRVLWWEQVLLWSSCWVSSSRHFPVFPRRKHRLTRTQSAFSPVVFSPLFTGEDFGGDFSPDSLFPLFPGLGAVLSRFPPVLSLLDDFSGTLPPAVLLGPVGSSLQSFPLPPPPPPHAADAFPRPAPLRPPEAPGPPPLPCPLARPDPGSFAASLRELEKCGWYWGPMNWEDAEMKLKGKPDGSFLVRDSSDPRYILSLSFRSQGITHHTRMEHYRGTFSLWCHPKFEDRCQSVVEFIKRAIMHSKNGKFLYFLRSRVPGLPPTPVQLLYPVSRFSNVKSLQHLCRFRIRQLVRIDHIPELPLPKPLISYIRKFYYYDPQEEQYLSLKEAQLISRQKQEPESST
uniref:Suppressor of cytokine signaling 7 n=1 Tax=Taeniopygia guttata TaxID=59729 RepID=H0YYQ7_TAEGU